MAAESIREREDLQRLLVQRIDIIGEDLLVVAEEYGLFQDSRRRVDILALDRAGNLVVVELKRTDDGGHMELQALRYAAMVSTITLDHLIDVYAEAHGMPEVDARETVVGWIDEPIEELPNHVRVILVSADFSTEITSTVLWLNENYSTDISCFRIVAYRLEGEIVLDLQQIIPLPEAKDFQIQQRQKGAAATAVRTAGRDFTQYEIAIGGVPLGYRSKQAAVKLAIQKLDAAGVPIEKLKAAVRAKSWVEVHPLEGESVRDAFVRENPTVSPSHRWFDLNLSDSEASWVLPRFGGADTEPFLKALATAAAPYVELEWRRADTLDSTREE
jgi:hypothetical protein